MKLAQDPGGSAGRWGPLFGTRADDWAETWEGPYGYGTPLYEYVLDRAKIGSGTRLLDCGCGAGRFARMAANRGANVAGIDAAKELIAIASRRTPDGDFRVGDLESLPWPDASFDWVTGFKGFQFADDKAKALAEAGKVLSLLDNETGMHSCLDSKPKLAGWRRRQEEASPWRREYRPRSGQARSAMSC